MSGRVKMPVVGLRGRTPERGSPIFFEGREGNFRRLAQAIFGGVPKRHGSLAAQKPTLPGCMAPKRLAPQISRIPEAGRDQGA